MVTRHTSLWLQLGAYKGFLLNNCFGVFGSKNENNLLGEGAKFLFHENEQTCHAKLKENIACGEWNSSVLTWGHFTVVGLTLASLHGGGGP